MSLVFLLDAIDGSYSTWCCYSRSRKKCSATGSKTQEIKGEERGNVGRGLVNDRLQFTGNPKPKDTDKCVKSQSNTCTLATETRVASKREDGEYEKEGSNRMLVPSRHIASSLSYPAKPSWHPTSLSGSEVGGQVETSVIGVCLLLRARWRAFLK